MYCQPSCAKQGPFLSAHVPSGRPPIVHEFAALDVGGLFRRRCAAKDGIAMRVSAEPGDDVAVAASLTQSKIAHWAEVRRTLRQSRLGKRDGSFGALQMTGPSA